MSIIGKHILLPVTSLTVALFILAPDSPQSSNKPKAAGEQHVISDTGGEGDVLVLTPISGLTAFVNLNGSFKGLEKLSNDELRTRYKKLADVIAKRSLSESNEAEVKNFKLELARIFTALLDHRSVTPDEKDSFFSIALSSPSIADRVTAGFSFLRSSEGAVQAARGQVADKQKGISLGLINADRADGPLEMGREFVPIKWSFRKVTDDVLPDTSAIYQIALQVTPSNLGRFTTPYAQSIVHGGHLENKDWICEISLPEGFRQQNFLASATLNVFSNEASFDSNRVSATSAIDLPLREISLTERPSYLWTLAERTLGFLKQFFGILGGIPTVIVAWQGVNFFKKKRKRGSTKKHPSQSKAEKLTPPD